MKKLLLLLGLPACLKAQEVRPITSTDYLSLIRKDTFSKRKNVPVDTSNNVGHSTLIVRQPFNGFTIGRIKIKDNELYVLSPAYKSLAIGGSFSSTVELKSINRLPALQTEFVQGRSQNGVTTWSGPETGELLSYGPSIRSLEYYGSSYAYDNNGRLVQKGTGTGRAANIYQSPVFRTGLLASQSFNLQGKFQSRGHQAFFSSLHFARSNEKLAVKNNHNRSYALATTLETQLSWLTIGTSFQTNHDVYTNDNRTGYLNRVYQQSLLTPISFDNEQGIYLNNGQRSYSLRGDNPFFLLEKNPNGSTRSHQGGSLYVEKKSGPLRFRLSQSVESTSSNSTEGMPAGSAYFSDGVLVQRSKTDRHYLLKATSSYDIRHGDGYLTSRILLNYLFGNHQSYIHYNPGDAYRFQRSANDMAVNYESNYRNGDFETGLHLTNRIYASNTAKEKKFFLPGISGFISLRRAFDLQNIDIKLSGSYQRFTSELPVGASFSQHSLLTVSTAEALQYLPLTEAEEFDALSLIQHKEWSTHLQLRYKNRLTLDADVFQRTTRNDIFPFVKNGLLKVGNLADHQNKGVEIEAGYYSYSRNLQTSHQLSFVTTRTKVLRVKDGYDYTAIAGFKNVHKALVKGNVLGAIVGSRYLRNSAGQMVIGSDGFPLFDQTRGVIGNPIPDFVMKTSNSLTWKGFSISADLEWKKGGDIWNGTQAALDYYGRSKTSGDLRNTTGYVFNGVTIDGHQNAIPVSFYDPSLPIEKNRWVRYGQTGVAEAYIEKGDHVRINNLSVAYKLTSKKYIQSVTVSLYANNLLLWSAYKGVDPNRLLYDASTTTGLDFFNLPSTKTFGCQVSLQF